MGRNLKNRKIAQLIYISTGSAIAVLVLFLIIFSILSKNNSKEKIDLQIGENTNLDSSNSEEASSPIGKTVEELEEYEEVADNNLVVETNTEDEINKQAQNSTNVVENKKDDEVKSNNMSNIEVEGHEDLDNQNQVEEIIKDPTFVMPINGDIIKEYGKDKLIYSDTLKEWTTHLGIDIKADKTAVVKASADGVVKSIKNDPRYGLTIVIEHENGFSSVYSNLLTAEFVVTGENVKSGQTIGTVGNSATFEILDDTHLHFEILKDGNSIDPQMYIK